MSEWIEINTSLPSSGDHVLVSIPWHGGIFDKSKRYTLIKLAIFTTPYRDDQGRYAKNGWLHECEGEMLEGVEKWCRIPDGS